MNPVRRAGLARLLALALLWGSNFLWIKIALRGFTPAQVLVVRLVLGALVLVVVVIARGGHLPRDGRLWISLFVAALFANVVPYLLFAVGEQQVDSAIAGVLNATTPLWTILIATAVRVEKRPSVVKLAGLVVGFIGVLLIFGPWRSGSQVMSPGGFACLVAAASYGVSYVYMARFLAGRGMGALELSASQLVAASVLSCIAIPVLGLRSPTLRTDALVAVVILGVLGTGLAYVINYRLIVDDGPSTASIVTYLLPVVALSLGLLTLRESLSLNVITGMTVVLFGVWLTRKQ